MKKYLIAALLAALCVGASAQLTRDESTRSKRVAEIWVQLDDARTRRIAKEVKDEAAKAKAAYDALPAATPALRRGK
jgi:hypothetical protein